MRKISQLAAVGLAVAGLAASLAPASAKEEKTISNLNLRTGPSKHYPVLAVIPAGAHVNVLNCGSEWCQVHWSGKVGYSDARWLVKHVTVAVPIKAH